MNVSGMSGYAALILQKFKKIIHAIPRSADKSELHVLYYSETFSPIFNQFAKI
jgi:hypothetical protein